MAMNLNQRGTVVESLSSAVFHGGIRLSQVPDLVIKLLNKSEWCDFVTSRGNRVQPKTFEVFVIDHPPDGLGSSLEQLKNLCKGNERALDLIDLALKRGPGQHTGNQYTKRKRNGIVDNVHDSKRPTGNSDAAGRRRLRKDRPDLHEKVLAGKISVHRAMVEAGFRPKMVTVPLEPKPAVKTLRRHFKGQLWDIFVQCVNEQSCNERGST